MPTTKTAEKEMRVAKRKQARNKSERNLAKSVITGAENLISSGDMEKARAAVTAAVSTLDKAAGKGVLHRNNSSRRKSRLIKKLNKAAAAPKTEEKKA